MAAINQDFEMYAGEDKQLNFTILDEKGEPAVLEGSSAVWMMAMIRTTPAIKISKSTEDQTILIEDNVCKVFIDKEDTTNKNGKYSHELRITNDDGKETVAAVGRGLVHSSITYQKEEE